MTQFESLSTDRLTLRMLQDDDLQAIYALRSDETVGRYIGRPLLQHIDEAYTFTDRIRNGYAAGNIWYWAICTKDSRDMIGTICLWNFSADGQVAEAGYEMLPRYYGNGYMQEALTAVCQYAFHNLKLTAIDAYTHRDNTRSINLLDRAGFVLCADRTDPDVPANVIYRKEY